MRGIVVRMTSVAVAAAATAGSLRAHHANVMFDTTAPVWLQGTVVTYTPVNPHTLFELDATEGGLTRRWTVEGPFLARLKRMGADAPILRPGDVIEVCGFPFKEKLGVRAATAGGFDVATFVHGHVLVMPDGRLQAWGPYGKLDNCVRPGDDPHRWVDFLNADALAREAWCDKARAATPTRPEVRELVADINRAAGDLCAPGVR